MGSSFGGVASVSTAARYPDVFGSLLLESPSLVFTDIGQDHGGGPVFDPVVKFVNRYRARPRRIVDRIYLTCGMYEPLITPNRSMVTMFREAGMEVGTSRRGTATTGRTGATGCATASPGCTPGTRSSSTSEGRPTKGLSMDKVVERWRSDRMQQDITLARWGHFGVPVLVFPTAGGDAEEVERHHLVGHLGRLVEDGRIKVYSLRQRRREGDDRATTATRRTAAGCSTSSSRRSPTRWCPAIHADTGGPNAVIVAGASIGAFNALALVCRYPDLFRAAVCMSGTFDIERFIGGFTDDLFFSSPMHFLPGLEGPALDVLRQRFVVLASGSGKWEDIGESWRAAERARREGRAQPGRRLGPGVRPRLADVVADAPGVPGTARRERRGAPPRATWPGSSPCPPSHDGAHAEACSAAADLVVELFAGAGVDDVRRVPTDDGSDAVVGFTPGPEGAPTVLLYSHYDVQPADPAAWASSPVGADRARRPALRPRGGRLQGQPGHAAHRAARPAAALAGRRPRRLRGVGGDVDGRALAAGGRVAGDRRGRRDARSPTPATSSSARRP